MCQWTFKKTFYEGSLIYFLFLFFSLEGLSEEIHLRSDVEEIKK